MRPLPAPATRWLVEGRDRATDWPGMKPGNDVLVVSGRWPRTHLRSAENHFAYCLMHGYRYVHCSFPTRERAYFHKIEYLSHHLPSAEFLLWLDDDVFFIDFSEPLESFFSFKSPGLELPGKYEPTGSLRLCSGQMLLRSSPRAANFLREVSSQNLNDFVRNGTINQIAPGFTGGDQDVIEALAQSDEFRDFVRFQEWNKFNGRFSDIKRACDVQSEFHLPPVVHFTGRRSKKHSGVRRAAKMLSRELDLIPLEVRPWPSIRLRARARLWRSLLDRGLIPAPIENFVLRVFSRQRRGFPSEGES